MTKRLLKGLVPLLLLLYVGVVIYSAYDAEGIRTFFGVSNNTKDNLHFIEFAILYLLVILVLGQRLNLASIVLIAIACFSLGILDEYHQSFMPGRNASYFDIFKDGIGVFFVWYAVSLWYLRQHR